MAITMKNLMDKIGLLKGKGLREADRKILQQDKQNEKWDTRGRYKNFWNQHNKSLGVNQLVDEIQRQITQTTLSAQKNLKIPWASMDPAARSAQIIRLSKDMAEDIFRSTNKRLTGTKQDVDRTPPGKSNSSKTDIPRRRHEKPVKKTRPRPNKRKDDTSPNKPKRARLKNPKPPFLASPQPLPTREPKPRFESRVGYFVSISTLGFYTEEPSIYESTEIQFLFEEQENGHLSMLPGQEWVSPWQEGPVIRGVNVDAIGDHRLKYSRNGDFET